MCRFDTQDGLFDLSWSEIHENQVVVASGDGSVKLFDVMVKVCICGGFWWRLEMRADGEMGNWANSSGWWVVE